MSLLQRLWQRIRSITLRQLGLAAIVVVVFVLVFAGIVYSWDYTNSSAFCGTACHTMPPHYQSFLQSPHARVQCVECHIGRTFVGVAFTRKANDAQYVINYLTQNYKYPIFVTNMQPARESCEKCHWPDKFSWDKVITFTDYASDKQNTPIQTTLVLKTGGGTAREGLGKGIHWHTQAQIDFAYTDDQKQSIPFIKVTNTDGTTQTYTDIESKLTPEELAKLPTRRMDCIDCHNRVSHNFLSPDDTLNTALSNKQIDSSIPEIKKKGVEVLTPNYPSPDAAKKAIADLETYYQQTYADYYAKNSAAVKTAIAQLQNWYTQIHYPEQGLDWTVHANDLGHQDWPGCFRCHDGKHFTSDKKQAIRLECNVCHTIPEVSTPGGPMPAVSLASIDEPPSHKTTTWLAEHRTVFNTSCQTCHDTNNAGGKDNSSFCSNSACHGSNWKFAGLNAPELAKIVPAPIAPKVDPNTPPKQIPHPIGGSPDCQLCHGPTSKVRPFPADHAGRTNDMCLSCHKPAVPAAAVTPAPGTPTAPIAQPAGGPPKIPHDIAGRSTCLGCHGSGSTSIPQITQFHKDYGFTNSDCLKCHKTAVPSSVQPTPAPTLAGATPAAKPTAAPAVSGPPALPANHAGRTICLGCHAQGFGPALSASHTGRTDDTCRTCHK